MVAQQVEREAADQIFAALADATRRGRIGRIEEILTPPPGGEAP